MNIVTFCIVCMNRLHHLKITLPKNIKDHQGNNDARFLLLDYNSQDGLEEWVKMNLSTEIAEGKLVYYKTKEPNSFNRSHSRNLAFKLVPEGLICNLDADNFTGLNFCSYINRLMSNNYNSILAVDRLNLKGVLKDVVGRICLSKEDFHSVKGFDESMQDYGFEDVDLVNRVKATGKNLIYMNKRKYLKAIAHSNAERYAEENITRKISDVLISHLEPQLTDIIFIYHDQTFEKGTLYDNINYYFELIPEESVSSHFNYPRYLIQGNWTTGEWYLEANQLHLNAHGESLLLEKQTFGLYPEELCYKEPGGNITYQSIISNGSLLSQIKEFYSSMNNWKKMANNAQIPDNEINPQGFGKGVVYRNFSEHSITVY